MSLFAVIILSVHYLLVGVLCIYGAHRIYHSLSARKILAALNNLTPPAALDAAAPPDQLPMVTVQAPMYNEKFVAKRIIDAVCAMDYPRERLQIQVIDDSTDESSEIVAAHVAKYKAEGFDISHIHRSNRRGYKAGALADAMPQVKGEFIAIFDADFIPHPDFLLKTLPHFTDKNIGLVQSRWTYLNTPKNMLTRLQSIMLDAHFGVEQVTRFGQNVFFNFNGTAGIWRKETINDAGGWRADTLTEDTDLSYRAQIKGWKFIYRPDIGCPSEIPDNMSAFKLQQHRWAKGAIEVMRKLLPSIWAADVPRRVKIEASFHLTGNLSYLFMFIDSVFFLLPSVYIRENMGFNILAWLDLPIFAFASLSHAWFFLSSQTQLYGRVMNKLYILPALLATSIGLGVNNGRAVIEALVGYKTGFARTPKSGDQNSHVMQNSYRANSQKWSNYFELVMFALYGTFAVLAAINAYWLVVPFLTLFSLGFLYTGLSSLIEVYQRRRQTKLSQVKSQLHLPKETQKIYEEPVSPREAETSAHHLAVAE